MWHCPKCESNQDDTASECENCGYVRPWGKLKTVLWIIIAALVISAGVIFYTYQTPQPTGTAQPMITRIVTATSASTGQPLKPDATPVSNNAGNDYEFLESGKTFLSGPNSGELSIGPSPVQIDSPQGIELYNLITEIEFFNPYGVSTGQWDYGITFRDNGSEALILLIRSDDRWAIIKKTGDSLKITSQGSISNLNLGDRQSNILKLIVNNDNSWLFVNDSLIKEITLPPGFSAGSVGVFSGYFPDDIISGLTTQYESWMIWSIE